MAYTRLTLRPILVEILLGMGEITREQGAALLAAPESDIDLSRLNFDSLTMLDFCLKVETQTEMIINPDELVELESLVALETTLLAKRA